MNRRDTAKTIFDVFVAQQTGQISMKKKKRFKNNSLLKWAKATERHQAISDKKMDMFPGPEHRTIIAGKYHV